MKKALCFRRGCPLWATEIVLVDPKDSPDNPSDYYTRLCKAHDKELRMRAKIEGGYSMVNTADSRWRSADLSPDNAWGWRLPDAGQ